MSMDTTWMATGNCNNHPPAVFFPSDGVGVEVAKQICGTCPVKEPCLEYALRQRVDHGVWGGASERQRRRILKARRQEAAAARFNASQASQTDDFSETSVSIG